jgi:hypothetical protein
MQPRTQYNSARARGESVSQPTRSFGHRGPTDYLRGEDLANAWKYLNNYYCGVLLHHIDVFAAALEVYKIKPHQPVTEYIWCLEIVTNMCNEIMKKPWNEDKMIRLLERGLRLDPRFSALCTTMELFDNSVAMNLSYLKLKENLLLLI